MLALAVVSLVLAVFNSIALGVIAFCYFRQFQVRTLQKPNAELADFLTDVKKHGYGCVRLDPDSLMLRSPR